MKKRYRNSNLMNILLFVCGLLMCLYPFISGIYTSYTQSQLIQTYEDNSSSLSENQINEEIQKAIDYNNLLYQKQLNPFNNNAISLKAYNEILNISDSSIIGSIEIPIIDVNMPIYHGTSETILSKGAGHMEETSFPIGGENTHSVITGHRGLPSSKLFTRLDELQKNDLFYINVLNQTIAYKIDKISIVTPNNIDSINIESGKDLVTLITCTPYGLNTHRLLVTGHRVPFEKEVKKNIEPKSMSLRELFFIVLPLLFIIFGIIIFKKKKGVGSYEKDC